ncbi:MULTISPECIES: DUF2267 domain-containing protein [unclassified Streptomyces]|uniref:DUF2267 domain-containing protein n=1 Tax=unclassified Streptomyces TaxID=2593676 RepID=UPI002DDA1FFD|nr:MULTISPECIES: DUF2267 domain-containing protein [unclassified Streptomyces]WSA90829.1 DUF2267 domain-containing protein [Streptomyces sp. NBC_01795]WSB75151.1 DUF2267 domain-containing protein [Streptomyces sp. NBC_01775]WSS16566.1 DUF2267 domain-containing protein [Streptomyces sp. NBC_01186]WSS45383.1 DUF2267 domain-containing protein [Streptomyces sp. NBC_01187]
MQQEEFLARVRERGEYSDTKEAAMVTEAVLSVLASRLTPGEAADLASQLPDPMPEWMDLDPDRKAESYGVEEFRHRVADRVGARPHTTQWDASAVLTTLADAVSGGEVNQIISQLPSGYAALFGKLDLSG